MRKEKRRTLKPALEHSTKWSPQRWAINDKSLHLFPIASTKWGQVVKLYWPVCIKLNTISSEIKHLSRNFHVYLGQSSNCKNAGAQSSCNSSAAVAAKGTLIGVQSLHQRRVMHCWGWRLSYSASSPTLECLKGLREPKVSPTLLCPYWHKGSSSIPNTQYHSKTRLSDIKLKLSKEVCKKMPARLKRHPSLPS